MRTVRTSNLSAAGDSGVGFGSAAVEAPEIDAVTAAVKAKLIVAREKLRRMNKNTDRKKKQNRSMCKNCMFPLAAWRRVVERAAREYH